MKNWLDNFACRVDMGIVVFLGASVVTYIVAIATVSMQAYRAARLNPVDTLRDEQEKVSDGTFQVISVLFRWQPPLSY